MNTVFDSAVALASSDGLDWLDGKFKLYLVDMNDAGPAAGAWRVTGTTFSENAAQGTTLVTYFTTVAHGLAIGDRVSTFGNSGSVAQWAASKVYKIGALIRPTSANGKRYRCVVPGTSGGSQPGSWGTTDGSSYVFSGTAVFVCDGPDTNIPTNAHGIIEAAASTTFSYTVPGPPPFSISTTGFVAKHSNITYLSEFVPSGGRVAVSDALTGKTIEPNGALDCTDPYITVPSPADAAEVLLLVKTAALDADPDLADTAQRLIAYYDSVSPLPLPANPGNLLFSVNSGTDKLMRL